MADTGTQQLTLQQFGAMVKQRYPGAYDHVDDAILGERTLEHYPQYRDRVRLDSSNVAPASEAVPTGLSHNRGAGPETTVPAPEPSGPSSFIQRLFPRLKAGELKGTQYQAAPEPANAADVRLGEMVPEGTEQALSTADKYLVAPFNRAAEAGAQAGRKIASEAVTVGDLLTHPQELSAYTPSPYGPKPIPPDPEQVAEARNPNIMGAARGIGAAAGGTITDPRNWPFLTSSAARPILQRLISGGFSAQMGAGSVETFKNLHDNWDKYTPAQRAELMTQGGLTGLMAAGAGLHALSPIEGPSITERVSKLDQAEPGKTQAAAPDSGELHVPPVQSPEGMRPGPGPGAQTAGSNEVNLSPMKQLTEWLPNVTSPKQSPIDRMKAVQAAVQAKAGYVYDDLQRKAFNAESSLLGLWDAYRRPPEWTGFDDAVGKWQGAQQYNSHQLNQFAEQLKTSVPDPVRREALTNYLQAAGDESVLRARAASSKAQFRRGYETAMKLSPDEKILANNIRNYLDSMLEEARRGGLLEQGVQDYVSQIWQKSPEQAARLQALNAASELSTKPFFTRERLFRDYFEGEQKGLQPVSKDIGFLLGSYEKAFGKALADKGLIKQLMSAKASDGRPLVQVSGVGRSLTESELSPETKAHLVLPHAKGENAADYIAIDSPAMRRYKWVAKDDAGNPIYLEGDVLAHPEIAKKLKNILTPSAIQKSKVGKAALKFSSEFKNTLLSLSAFHQVQLGVHGLEHLVNPVRLPKLDLENATQRALVDHGLMVSSFDSHAAFSEGLHSSGLVNKIPGIGKRLAQYQDYLFKDYLPRLKMAMALHALQRNIKRYGSKLNRDQILRLTSEQANAAFGHLNYNQLGRNKTLQDVLRLTVLAPDFLEARGRFVGQALKPYGREQARALATGAAVMYVGARLLNQILNGNSYSDDPSMAFAVRVKNRTYSLRTIQGDLLHMVTKPREFVEHRLNPVTTRPLLEGLTGRDTFGRPRSGKEQVQDFVKNVVPIPLQGLRSPGELDLKESAAKSLGFTATRYRSPAARKAHEFVTKGITFSESSRSPEQQDLMKRYRSQIDAGKFSADQVRNDYQAGRLTERDARELMKESKSSQLSRDFNRLSLEKALAVWQEANEDERKELRPLLEAKAKRQLPNRVPAEREGLKQRVQQALSEKSAPYIPSRLVKVLLGRTAGVR